MRGQWYSGNKKENKDMKEEFDVHKGHGNHIECVCEPGADDEFLSRWISRSIAEGELIWGTKKPIACNFGDKMPKKMPLVFLGDKTRSLRLGILLAVIEAGKRSGFVSAYPEFDGAEVNVKLTSIHEWAAGVEATLEGEVLGDSAWNVAFFDTRYSLRKGQYEIGKTYVFRLAAFAYRAEVVPEKDRELRFEGDKAIEQRKRFGVEQEYEADGSPKPLVFGMEELVSYFPNREAYPDDAEFQSPVYGKPESFSAFDSKFYRLNVAIAREEENVVVIPMVARQSLFAEAPKAKEPVRGVLWLQGYCIDRVANGDGNG